MMKTKNNAAFDYAQAAGPTRWLSEAETTVCIDTELKIIFEKLGV